MRASSLGPVALVGGAVLLLGGLLGLLSPASKSAAPDGVHFMTEAEFERRIHDHRFPSDWKGDPPAEITALLGGLKGGERLIDNWEVRVISKVTRGSIYVDMARLPWDGFNVRITLRDPSKPGLTETSKYALYIDSPRPGSKHTPEDQVAVMGALETRLAKTEGSVATPAGMTELVVTPPPPPSGK